MHNKGRLVVEQKACAWRQSQFCTSLHHQTVHNAVRLGGVQRGVLADAHTAQRYDILPLSCKHNLLHEARLRLKAQFVLNRYRVIGIRRGNVGHYVNNHAVLAGNFKIVGHAID